MSLPHPHPAPWVAVVDDDGEMRAAILALVQAAGFEGCGFATGPDLLDRVASDVPACVVLDMDMPDMDGLTVQARLAVHPDLPVIFVSGAATPAMQARALAAGARTFLHKPVCGDELLDAVEAALGA